MFRREFAWLRVSQQQPSTNLFVAIEQGDTKKAADGGMTMWNTQSTETIFRHLPMGIVKCCLTSHIARRVLVRCHIVQDISNQHRYSLTKNGSQQAFSTQWHPSKELFLLLSH